jgi:hypothetical protein
MRSDWVPLSASALVVGAMALVFGALLNPADTGSTAAQTLRVVQEDGGRWVAMSVMYVFASVALTLGLPAMLVLFSRRGRVLGLVGLAVFSVGSIGTAGYAMLMVFFKAMVAAGAVTSASALDEVTSDKGLAFFLAGWIGSFYGGILLLALALFRAGTVPRWVPLLLLVFVVMIPIAPHVGRLGTAVQVLAMAVAFTGVAMAAVTGDSQRSLVREPSF